MTDFKNFEKSMQKSMEWLHELHEHDSIMNEQGAYHMLRAVMHTLRDRLTVDEAAELGAQLPMIIRGMYYEGWDPSMTPTNYDTETFMIAVQDRLRPNHADYNVEAGIHAVFDVLQRHVTAGEIKDVQSMLPENMAEFWPEKRAA